MSDYAPGMTPEYQAFQDLAAREVEQAAADDQRRQEQAAAFMDHEGPGVTAGQERHTGQ